MVRNCKYKKWPIGIETEKEEEKAEEAEAEEIVLFTSPP